MGSDQKEKREESSVRHRRKRMACHPLPLQNVERSSERAKRMKIREMVRWRGGAERKNDEGVEGEEWGV